MVFVPIIISLVSALIFIGVNGLILWWVSRWFKFAKQDSKTAFSVSAIAGAVTFVLGLIPLVAYTLTTNLVFGIAVFIVNAGVLVWLIMKYYKATTLKALLVWVIIFGIDIVIGFILGIILAVFSGALGPGLGGVVY